MSNYILDRAAAIEKARILKSLIALSEAEIIQNTFVSAFINKTVTKRDNLKYLHGNFNLGGTVSGRLSSSQINLQNLPSSGSKYAKAVKECFVAPSGWILCGADFTSLEDRISALTTKDPNKIKVYTGLHIYELNINGTTHHIREDATINFNGKTYTGEAFYEAYRSS